MRRRGQKLAAAGAAAVALVALSAPRAHAQAHGKPIEMCLGEFEEGQMQQKRGKHKAALALYDACATGCPDPIAADCNLRRTDVERLLPTASFVVRDASGVEVSAQMTVDKRPYDQAIGLAEPIDPGPHIVTWSYDGRYVEEWITIHEGEHGRVVVLMMEYGPPKKSRAEGAARGHTAWPYILGGTGLALLTVGIVTGVSVLTSDRATDQAEYKSQQSLAAVSTATTVIGLGALGAGLVWLLLEPTGAAPPSKTPAARAYFDRGF